MFQQYDEQTASTEDRIAWALCQIIDDDAPMLWTRYRFVAECIAGNEKLMADLKSLGEPGARHPALEECEKAGIGPVNVPGKGYSEGGLPNTAEERARFEAYMRGHCWDFGAFDAKTNSYDTVEVRRLYGVWRDRGWLAMKAAQPQQATGEAAVLAKVQREPVAWRWKERINDEFDSGWRLTSFEPPTGPRTIAIEPLYNHHAQPRKRTEQDAWEDWAAKVRPAGDVDEVQRRWLASPERRDFMDEDAQPSPLHNEGPEEKP